MSESNAPGPSPQGNRLPRRLIVSAVLLCLVLTGLLLSLPRLAQEFLVPALAKALQAPGLSIDIRRVSFSGLDLGQISVAEDGDITASAMLVDWSLSGLMHGRVDRVRILGLDLRGAERNGRWEVSGLPRLTRTSATDSGPMFLPDIAELRVDGRIGLDAALFDVVAPFAVNGSLREGQLLLDAQTALAGQNLVLGLKADLGQRDFRLTCALPPASVAALASLFPALRNLPASGTIESLIDMALPPDQSPRIQANLDLSAMQTLLGSTRLTQDGRTSMRMAWQNGPRFNLDPVHLATPLPLILTVSEIETDLEKGILGCSWDMIVAAAPGLDFTAPPRLAGRIDAMRTDRGWNVRTRTELDPIQVSPTGSPDLKTELAHAVLTLDVATNASETRSEGVLHLGQLRLTGPELSLSLTDLDLHANATAGSAYANGTVDLAGGRLDVRRPGLTLSTTRLDGQALFDLGDRPVVNASLNVNARATAGETTAIMTARLPLAWPAPTAMVGSVKLDLNHGKASLARISTRIVQDMQGLSLDGVLNVLPVAVRAPITGRLDLMTPGQSWMEITANQTLELPGDLARLVPALGGLSGSGRLDLRAHLDLSRGIPGLPTSVKIDNLTLTHAQSKTTLSNGSFGLTFADLLTARSDPDQRLAFDRLQLGSVILDTGDIRFQVEAPHSVLVEGCVFKWAGGRIGSQAFRINPSIEDYTVELYCDRVELTKALEQFGMSQAQGGGTANGRIPIHWSNGVLTFDNGFLYSTPGEKGVLRVQGTQILTAGVPPGTPQHGQLDLAAEALKDFAYEWAKVRMNTEGEELVISLELDGKPGKPLPFTYDRNIGGFARVSATSPGSVFQGIRLDVNFRLPLDQLLQYRQLMELITNGG